MQLTLLIHACSTAFPAPPVLLRHAHPPPLPHHPQSCGWSGGVWDDRDIVSWETAGGRCLTPAEAAAVLAEDKDAEEVLIQASSDGNVTGGWAGQWGGICGGWASSWHGRLVGLASTCLLL